MAGMAGRAAGVAVAAVVVTAPPAAAATAVAARARVWQRAPAGGEGAAAAWGVAGVGGGGGRGGAGAVWALGARRTGRGSRGCTCSRWRSTSCRPVGGWSCGDGDDETAIEVATPARSVSERTGQGNWKPRCEWTARRRAALNSPAQAAVSQRRRHGIWRVPVHSEGHQCRPCG